ncbi:pimeloyl-ACP methyl ester carboxylesterase [Leifsonia sp. AK011]|uniref:alpha/beta fold hydrolase n=1 Tax=Leifsonia sp. AK011 TaxID=2723075 RepID=UPI0015CB6FBF|nr:alpha/beta hydrolase [Leifsonia sp. AK011]NYF09215.1 pimeloyl-ACP methyl ester carboxylesterase [Leifsonia sp. AK011]
MSALSYRTIEVDGLNIFVREAGDSSKPTLVLLPGFPSSTRAFTRLIDRLAPQWHVVAIDYPGFGSSDPLPESPTFDRIAEVVRDAIDQLGVAEYVLYMFDLGAPVGFRVALEHDERVRGIVTQSGNAYVDGFGPGVAGLAEWWQDREKGQPTVDAFVSLAGTRMQWQVGARNPEHVDPDQAIADQAILDLPGRSEYMKAILWDYQNNPAQYPVWQAWLRRRQPKVLAIWGKNDPFFIPAGAVAFQRDVPDTEVILLDTGHFALEEEVDAIAEHTSVLLERAFAN